MSDETTTVDATGLKSVYLDDDMHFTYVSEQGIDFRNRVVVITAELESVFEAVDMAFTEMESDPTLPITVKIKCGGGCVYDAMAILGRFKSSPCVIIAEGYGMVMSAATILLAGANVSRMSEYGSFMWHHGTVTFGTMQVTDVAHEAAMVAKMTEDWCQIMARLSTSRKANTKFWDEIGNKDTYLTAKELKKLGVIDEII